jgi:glutamate-1-semialdehyde 2,1-aminomutase
MTSPVPRRFDASRSLLERLHDLVPGGAHTYAKGDDQYPEAMAPMIVRGEGCRVEDVDGNRYLEYGIGLRSVTLGHAYGPVIDAAAAKMRDGTNFVRPSTIELEAAEEFLAIVRRADMVKFAKNGSDATTAAVRLARAATGRTMVAICAEQPFFSVDDWFIGATGMPAGVPDETRQLTVRFHYNDIESVRALFDAHPHQIACIVLEPATYLEPQPGFLSDLRDLCHERGALLIFDEMITGFRWHLRGAQEVYDVTPDLAAFGKALGNGFSISALAGRRDLMELGGLHHERERVFLLSTTHGAETHALAAAIAVMEAYQERDVVDCLYRQGSRLAEGVRQAIGHHGLEGHVEVLGRPCNLVYATRDQERQPSQPFRTLFLQETIRRGLLAPSLVISYAHDDPAVDETVEIIDQALGVYRSALDDGIERHLEGRPVKPAMRSRN